MEIINLSDSKNKRLAKVLFSHAARGILDIDLLLDLEQEYEIDLSSLEVKKTLIGIEEYAFDITSILAHKLGFLPEDPLALECERGDLAVEYKEYCEAVAIYWRTIWNLICDYWYKYLKNDWRFKEMFEKCDPSLTISKFLFFKETYLDVYRGIIYDYCTNNQMSLHATEKKMRRCRNLLDETRFFSPQDKIKTRLVDKTFCQVIARTWHQKLLNTTLDVLWDNQYKDIVLENDLRYLENKSYIVISKLVNFLSRLKDKKKTRLHFIPQSCPDCRSTKTIRNGTRNNKRRYKCKKCGRQFSIAMY